jgi:cytochrome c6
MSKNDGKSKSLLIAFVIASFLVGTVPSARADDTSSKLYGTKCAACHGPDGKGQTAVGKADNIRDLAAADVQKQSDEDLTATITNGKGKMPAYGKSLKPDQIKGLVAYIRSLAKS